MLLVPRELRALLAPKVFRGAQPRLGPRVRPELQELQVQRAQPELRAFRVRSVIRALPELVAQRVQRVRLGQLVLLEFRDQSELQGQLEPQDRQVQLDQRG